MSDKILSVDNKLLVYNNKLVLAPSAELQDKIVTPTLDSQVVTPDAGYLGLNKVIVEAMPAATQATPSIEVDSSGLITASTTQDAGYVTAGTKSTTKQLPAQGAQTIIPGTADKTIEAGKYLTGVQTIKGDTNLIPENIAKDVVVFGITGTHQSGEDVTAELTEQDELIEQISLALEGKAVAAPVEAYAVISVIYPEGSTCTCTDGTTTLTLETTSGTGFFLISTAGDWTVSATDGTNTRSKSVSITSEGQSEIVELNYNLVLFDNGSVVEWTSYARLSGNDSCSIGSSLVCTRNSGVSLSYTGAVVYTYEAILLTGYSQLNVQFKSVSGLSSYIGVCDASTSNKDQPTTWAASKECTVAAFGSGGVATLDISALSGQSLSVVLGEQYVKNETGSSCEVTKVWLS